LVKKYPKRYPWVAHEKINEDSTQQKASLQFPTTGARRIIGGMMK
jgi:hypothetical protein